MAYIGREPQIGNFQVCDAISTVNNQAAYTMQVGSVNVSPETENHMLVSLNGILQAPTTSYTVSGSTITFAANLVTGDVINFIQILGSVLDLGVPSDNTVTTAKLSSTSVTAAKLNADIISGTTALTAEPADTDEFLVSDAGVLKRIDYSLIKGGGITEADQWRISANFIPGSSNETVISSNWERADGTANGYFGNGMSQSSGIFTFPSTGYYLIDFVCNAYASGNGYVKTSIQATTNNSSYSRILLFAPYIADGHVISMSGTQLIDVTNTSNVKIRFLTEFSNSNSIAYGNTTFTYTGANFTRLGNT